MALRYCARARSLASIIFAVSAGGSLYCARRRPERNATLAWQKTLMWRGCWRRTQLPQRPMITADCSFATRVMIADSSAKMSWSVGRTGGGIV